MKCANETVTIELKNGMHRLSSALPLSSPAHSPLRKAWADMLTDSLQALSSMAP